MPIAKTVDFKIIDTKNECVVKIFSTNWDFHNTLNEAKLWVLQQYRNSPTSPKYIITSEFGVLDL